ncbi:phage major capsid protein [Bacillus thuringiensis]|uniref:phage major capsid protein n=1 Tax=Bacillus thuringiensis TaxID=1428 RepID=UPI000BEE04FB|nr:phage major capsid protein [Bacillus thuringiensis]PEB44187.1 phage major capsid protein [Bacillus thuringiensis]
MNETIEKRNFSLSEVNQSSDGFFVRGLVNQTGEWSQTLYDKHGNPFVERVMPSVFENALKRGNDVKLLLEHDKNVLLARTKDETLKLTETSRGLEMEANLVPSNQSEHIHALIKRGTLNKMSFGMVVLDDDWKQEDGVNKRSITELALYECSIVSDPAYTQSTVEARSQNIIEDVEVPNLTERNYQTMKFESMTSKQLEERKQELLSEADEIEESKATEQRSFTPSEQLRQEAILNEIRTINEQIDLKNKTQRNGEIIMNTNTIETNFETEKRAVEQFLRKQDGDEVRAMQANYGTGAGTGALTIPTTMSDYIVEKLTEYAPIFARTKNFTPESGFLEILREKSIGTGGFVGEMQDVVANDFTMDKVRLDQKRVGTAIELSQHLVNDSGIDVVGYSIGLLSRRLGLTLDNSVLVGDKATQFEGILNDLTIGEQTGLATNAITIDELLDLYNSMNPAYIGGAVWVVSRQTFNMIAKLKNDKNGEYYLVRDVAENGPTYKLFGQPVIINDTMPAPEAGQRAVLFANFSEGYVTMTKKGLNLKHITADTKQALRGSQLIVLDGYMDGKVLNPAAIKVLKLKA